MKTLSILFLAACCLAISVTAPAQEEDTVFPYDYTKMVLDNGFTAYLINAGAPNQIAFVTMVRTGSRDEYEPGKSGFAHFFEHMMFRGTERYPNYDEVAASFGAARNAFTSNDMTVYYMVAASEYLERIMDLESDRFMNLDYSEEEFRTEAGAILGEFNQSKYSPFQWLDVNTRKIAWTQHTYRHSTIGYEEDVRAMPEGYEYSISFHQRYYRPENCVLVLVGDYDIEATKPLVEKYYGDWERGYVKPQIPEEPEQVEAREATIDYPGRTKPIINVNYKAPAWSASDKTAVALEVLGQVAFGQNSDIYRKLVLNEQKVQYISPGFGLARDPGLVSITTMVNNPDEVEAIKAEIADTIETFSTELADPQVLADTKSNIKYSFLNGLETAQNVAFSLIQVVINTGGIEAIEEYYDTLETITPEDLREAARQYLVESGRTTVTMVQAEGR